MKFCVDVDILESKIALSFIDDVSTYDELTDAEVQTMLEDHVKDIKDFVMLDMLDKIVQVELRTNMKNSNAKACMQYLFTIYHIIIYRNGLTWIMKDNQKVAGTHVVLSAIQPPPQKERLEADLSFSQHALRQDFTCFLAHAIKIAEGFQPRRLQPAIKAPSPRRWKVIW